MIYAIKQHKSKLINLTETWKSPLQIILGNNNDDSEWGPTARMTKMPKQLEWDSMRDDMSSVGGDMEGSLEEDPGFMETIETVEEMAFSDESVESVDSWV
jgi:hypothetical protein